MKIKYKEPYWVKFQWDISDHHDNQYVTDFDKETNEVFNQFLYSNNFIITTKFKIKSHYKKDDIAMIFGKPGKNLGLSYNQSSKTMAFEFWTKGVEEDKFQMIVVKNVTIKEIENGVTISIVKSGNKISVYKNFEEGNTLEIDTDFIIDYAESSLFIGCSNPDIESEKHRYYCEMDISHFSILNNIGDIEIGKDLFETPPHGLLWKKYYEDIICFYDFENKNNLGIIYDESKYTNFLERVPSEYIK